MIRAFKILCDKEDSLYQAFRKVEPRSPKGIQIKPGMVSGEGRSVGEEGHGL